MLNPLGLMWLPEDPSLHWDDDNADAAAALHAMQQDAAADDLLDDMDYDGEDDLYWAG